MGLRCALLLALLAPAAALGVRRAAPKIVVTTSLLDRIVQPSTSFEYEACKACDVALDMLVQVQPPARRALHLSSMLPHRVARRVVKTIMSLITPAVAPEIAPQRPRETVERGRARKTYSL
ncbi:hypothetical protein M885DRAFT_524652 [Pelagophyceae sp. CCMP2097]|nr:hypothetical protein M885DRAFT_524652 [Pelagophyceae sp. CCMP2097]|mmetsp:Transcript_29461/g.99251  ORF Transcript_29461/g.99251 Transcript_29461/m.99251 type:complete len:121 (-) Transcript_29461:230-592(-)